MSKIIGIDPGKNFGVAVFNDGALTELKTLTRLEGILIIESEKPDVVVIEDSRLQSHVWNAIGKKSGPALKIGRNVGQIDLLCDLVQEMCEKIDTGLVSVSPRGKGAKLNAETFKKLTGWTERTNEHQRDAAAVAWKYRNMRSNSGW